MVIEHMGGEIECTSQPDKGTVIDFYIKIGSRLDDDGLSEKEHLDFENNIEKTILESKNLIQNLYIQMDEQQDRQEILI